MTIVGVGNPVPCQLYLMQLAGLVVEGRSKVFNPSEGQRSRSRENGYQMLREITGKDFGFNVLDWYKHLISGDYGLTHPYGFGAMKRFLKGAGFTLPSRKDLLRKMVAESAPPETEVEVD